MPAWLGEALWGEGQGPLAFWSWIRIRTQHADQSLLNLRKPRAAGLRMDLDDERGEAGERGGRSLPLESRNTCGTYASRAHGADRSQTCPHPGGQGEQPWQCTEQALQHEADTHIHAYRHPPIRVDTMAAHTSILKRSSLPAPYVTM